MCNSDLVEDSFYLTVDEWSTKSYCNYVINPAKFESKDFIFVSTKVWNYLYSNFGGRPIKRLIITNLSNEIQVELNPIRLDFVVFPQENFKTYSIILNAKEYLE